MNKTLLQILILIVVSIHCVSCFPSYSAMPKEFRNIKPLEEKTKVFVLNRDLKTEFKILKSSKIYEIVKDSNLALTKIKLNPIKNITGFRCGNPMIGAMMTFGLLPYFENQRFAFNYDEIKNNEIKNHNDTIEVRQSLWLFNFVYPKSFKKQAGKTLLGNYLNRK